MQSLVAVNTAGVHYYFADLLQNNLNFKEIQIPRCFTFQDIQEKLF